MGVQAQEVSVNRASDLYFKRSPIERTGENAFNEPLPAKPALSPIIPLSEVLFQNVFVWWWDRYVIDKNYARVNRHIWKRNFEEGWTWDNNHFAINFFGHPVQGMFYYQAARSTGYGFYSSFFYTLIGSYTWEMFAEREYPSANDLITTSVGGTVYGEVFFRLSQRLLANPNRSYWDEGGAFVSSPLGYLQRKSLGIRAHNPGYAPLDLSIRAGGGIRFGNEYRYDEISDNRSDGDWNQESGFAGFNLIYGRPNKTIKEPFDYFTVDFTQDYGSDGMLFHLDATGKLKNYNMNSGRNYMDVGSYLHFDTFYGDLVEMSANSIGLGADMNIWLSNNIRFRLINMPSFVLLGSSDFNYDDVLAAKDTSYEKTRSYQLSTGANYKMSLELEYKAIGQIKNLMSVFLFKTMPGSEPHYGAYGYDLVGFNSTNLEGFLPWGYILGLRFESYLKAAAYEGDDFEPMYRLMHSLGIYIKYIL